MEQNEVLKALRRDHAAELKLAAERLKGTARHTEIIPSPVLSEMTGHEILLKPENLQVTGSFKIRGAYNKIASLSDEQLSHGIVTASAGNHAQGVAYAARERGAKATICMPQITPPLKVDATKAYGADVVLCGEVFDEAAAHAQELSDNEGMIYVPPFDDYEVLCGQGTIGLEILEDVPNVTDVVVPLGGGGLGAGVALAIKTFKPEVRVIGAIPEGSPAWKNSLAAGHVVAADQVRTSAEGVAVKRPGDLTFALLNEFLDDLVTVTERDINEMILLMLEKHKLVVEAAGAVSLAALEHLNLRSRKFAEAQGPHVVVPILSGGNEDTVSISAVIQKGMIARGRIMNLRWSFRILRASWSRWPRSWPNSALTSSHSITTSSRLPAITLIRFPWASPLKPTALSTSTASLTRCARPVSGPSASTDFPRWISADSRISSASKKAPQTQSG